MKIDPAPTDRFVFTGLSYGLFLYAILIDFNGSIVTDPFSGFLRQEVEKLAPDPCLAVFVKEELFGDRDLEMEFTPLDRTLENNGHQFMSLAHMPPSYGSEQDLFFNLMRNRTTMKYAVAALVVAKDE